VDVMKGLASIVPPVADASAVAEAVVKVVDTPFGSALSGYMSIRQKTAQR
jgi:hypothetical protein